MRSTRPPATEVVLSETNAIEPIVKTTKVEGTTVSYEMTPAFQPGPAATAGRHADEAERHGRGHGHPAPVGSRGGGQREPPVKGDGETTETSVKVTEVNGLLMNFQIYPA